MDFLGRFKRVSALAAALAGAVQLSATGSPPLITDDPGTPGPGHWEINFGISTEHRPGLKLAELPAVDVNYGIGETLQVTYEVPWLVAQEDGRSRRTGLGNSGCGVKWRFHDTGEGGTTLSVYPKLEFNTPGSSSADRGLVDRGTAFRLPVQFQQDVGPVTVNLQLGREFRSAGDSWFYGAALSHQLQKRLGVAVELAGGAAAKLDRSNLTLNLGVVYDLSEGSSLLFSAGRELHNHDEPKASFIGYVGWQLRL